MYTATIKTGSLVSRITVKAETLTLAVGIVATCYISSKILKIERVLTW